MHNDAGDGLIIGSLQRKVYSHIIGCGIRKSCRSNFLCACGGRGTCVWLAVFLTSGNGDKGNDQYEGIDLNFSHGLFILFGNMIYFVKVRQKIYHLNKLQLKERTNKC